MKIIITVNTYYPLTDGVQAVTEYEAEGLAKLGNDVTVVTTKVPGCKTKEKHEGVNIIRYDIKTQHALYRGDIGGYRNLILKLCNTADILINVSTQTATTEVLFPILKKIKCKKVLYMHGFHDFEWHKFDFDSLSTLMHKVWNNLRWRYDYLKNANHIKEYDKVIQLHQFVNSTKYFEKKYHITPTIIGNAADDDFFIKSSKPSPINERYVISVANYLKEKNQAFLLNAFYQTKIKDCALVLIGSEKNSYSDYLENLKKDLDRRYGNRKVYFLSNIPRKDISVYVQSASIFLMGSKKEIFPISIIEAMAASVPFISTDVGIVRYLPGGAIISSEKDMAFWIDLLLYNSKVASDIGRSGKEYAKKHFVEQTNVKKLYSILHSL